MAPSTGKPTPSVSDIYNGCDSSFQT
jgi:hypothetical protein